MITWIETHAQGIQTFFVSLSALSALFIYWRNSVRQRRIALVSMIMQHANDEKVKAANKMVRKLYNDNNKTLVQFIDADGEERRAILTVANHYEFMCVAIRHGAFDEKTYKALEFSNLVKNWIMLESFIKAARAEHSNQTWFQDFERIAKKWQNSPLKTVR